MDMTLVKIMASLLRTCFHDESGGTLTLTAVVFPVLLGASGLALDGAHWYSQRRATQTIVDAAAVSSAYAKLEEKSQDDIYAVALEEAVRNGYEAVADNTLTVTDASAGGGGGGATAPLVDVSVSRQVPLYFASLFMEGRSIIISARALSGVRFLGPQCIIALNQSASRAVEFAGNTTADIGCGVVSNSDSEEALYIGGNAQLMANPAQAFGDIRISGSGQLISQLPPLPFSPRVADPFADLPSPPSPPCDVSGPGKKAFTATSGAQLVDTNGDGYITVCGGLEFSGNVNLDSGTYVVRNGDVSQKTGGTSVSGSELSFLLTGDNPTKVGGLKFNSNANLDMSAPTSGTYKGILFYQDPKVVSPSKNILNGGVDLELDGVIYFPASHLSFSGGASNPNNCLQVVADTVTFTGNSFVRNDPTVCENMGLADGGSSQRQVVLLQ